MTNRKYFIEPQPTPTRFLVGQIFLANGATYEVEGVHLGGVGQTSTIAVKPLSEKPNCCKALHVPEHILEDAFRGGAIFLDDLIAEAIQRFGGMGGLFNTACFQASIGRDYSAEEVARLLSLDRRIVRLHGGSHWFLLPDEMRRYEQSE